LNYFFKIILLYMLIIAEHHKTTRRNVLMNLLTELGYRSIIDFQRAHDLVADGLAGINTYNALYQRLLKVVDLQNFAGNFYRETHQKKQIVWHHSAGWDDARGMYDWWRQDGAYHVATAIGIVDAGIVFRGYDEGFWAHHIGMQHPFNVLRNQQSVAVEICNWGALTEVSEGLKSWAGAIVPKNKTIELSYKGIKYYEIYTDAEIESLKKWTLLNALRFGIPLKYNEADMWQVSQNAIDGVAGIYTHNSFLSWKSDVSPQPKLIAMAKKLKEYEK
jgi:hypothetical protein